jgi:signal transduction protein with GAF and PtsI domain
LTHGLRAGSVHHTRLRVGEGLVGDIVAQGRPLTVMFRIVAEGAELDRSREIFGLELERMQKRGMTPIPKEVRVGVMIEVSSLAAQLAGRADCVSIGTNNLARHFFASRRTSSR